MIRALTAYANRSTTGRVIADVLLLGAGLLVAWMLWLGLDASARADHRVCVQIEVLKHGFRDSLNRGLKSLPTITYYKQHPKEKAQAVAEIRRQLRLYAPHRC